MISQLNPYEQRLDGICQHIDDNVRRPVVTVESETPEFP
jgi:hypothetical protein